MSHRFPQRLKSTFLKCFLHSRFPSATLHMKFFQKTLILAFEVILHPPKHIPICSNGPLPKGQKIFEANSTDSLNCTFFGFQPTVTYVSIYIQENNNRKCLYRNNLLKNSIGHFTFENCISQVQTQQCGDSFCFLDNVS